MCQAHSTVRDVSQSAFSPRRVATLCWNFFPAALVLLATFAIACSTGARQPDSEAAGHERSTRIIDLSHKLQTFRPSPSTAPDKRFAADLAQPVGASRPVSAFADQTVLIPVPDRQVPDGVFKRSTMILGEHIGTHIDSPGHFVSARPEVPNPDLRGLADLTVEDLTGPVVLIDISARVEAELRKNNGSPGPVEVTNFSNASTNVVTPADIDAVASRLQNRSYLIIHTGWSRFFPGSGPGSEGPYMNGSNYPGMSRDAVARLIEIEASRNIKINGIGADNVSVDAGDDVLTAPKPGVFPTHARGLQRGWKLLENLTNTAELRNGQCTLFIGAMNHIGGFGGFARIFASCSR